MKYKILPLILFALLFIFACGEDPITDTCDYDLTTMQSNIADQIIIPRYVGLNDATTALITATNAFTEVPNTSSLTSLQVAWETAYLAYQKVSVFEFGPAADNGFSFRERMNVFPTNATGLEEQAILGTTKVDDLFKSLVGFPAVEYMIFGENTSVVVDAFSSDIDGTRAAFLSALVGELATKSQLVLDGWNNGYRDTFVNSEGSSDGSAMHFLVNEINQDYELLKNFKFKLPLGVYDGGVIQPEKVEGYYSGKSLLFGKAQLDGLVSVYKGIGETGVNSEGLQDYLTCLKAGEDSGELLADAIAQQLDSIASKMNDLSDPLTDLLVADKEAVSELQSLMQQLVPLTKGEMASAFGVKISYQDNDGD